MTTKTTDRTTSADLAARLRERAAEYEEAGREKLRAESALLAAMANYERARYRERAAREEWARVLDAAARGIPAPRGINYAVTVGGVTECLAVFEYDERRYVTLCGFVFSPEESAGVLELPTYLATCAACLAALDEVAP
jgi:hypothetical protein